MHLDKLLFLCGLVVGANSRPILSTSEGVEAIPQRDPNTKEVRLFGVNIQAPNPTIASSIQPIPPTSDLYHQWHGEIAHQEKGKRPVASTGAAVLYGKQAQGSSSPSHRKALIKKYFAGDSFHLDNLLPKYRREPGKTYTYQQLNRIRRTRSEAKTRLLDQGQGHDRKRKFEDILLDYGAEGAVSKPKSITRDYYISWRDHKRELGIPLTQSMPRDLRRKTGRKSGKKPKTLQEKE